MASFEKVGKKWRYVISYKDENNQYKKLQKSGFRTKQEAKTHANEVEYQLKYGYNLVNNVEFAEYFKQWYEINKKPSVSAKTLGRYEVSYKEIKDYFKHKPLKDIKRGEYQQFLNHYGSTHGYDTTNKLNSYIRNCFDYAIHEGLVLRNPTFKATINYANEAKSEDLKYISESEFKRLKHHLESKETTSAMLLLMVMATGARFQEVAKLKRDDFNISKNEVHLPGTKTETSDRTISIDRKTMQRVQNFIKSRPSDIKGYVFTEEGHTLSNTSVNKALRYACKNSSVKEITVHSIRHTVASILLHHDCSIYYVAKRLGHRTIKSTLEIYGHLLEEGYEKDNQKAMSIMENI
ncbi:tyrosine-type recombinase/integrase [Staphylococcus nepalensis]|uniref:tyrosine-type recombinase/integrase n=1 Tax=Staphylococcus nepalensis TaxID=214473 RepID=UPI003CF76DBC